MNDDFEDAKAFIHGVIWGIAVSALLCAVVAIKVITDFPQ
jgi:hypothetical protein